MKVQKSAEKMKKEQEKSFEEGYKRLSKKVNMNTQRIKEKDEKIINHIFFFSDQNDFLDRAIGTAFFRRRKTISKNNRRYL